MTDQHETPEALAAEIAELLPKIGTLPLAESWMYQAIRHCQRNMDFDLYDGDEGNEPDRQSGTAIAKVLNRLPEILAALRRTPDNAGDALERLDDLIFDAWETLGQPKNWPGSTALARQLAPRLTTPQPAELCPRTLEADTKRKLVFDVALALLRSHFKANGMDEPSELGAFDQQYVRDAEVSVQTVLAALAKPDVSKGEK